MKCNSESCIVRSNPQQQHNVPSYISLASRAGPGPGLCIRPLAEWEEEYNNSVNASVMASLCDQTRNVPAIV